MAKVNRETGSIELEAGEVALIVTTEEVELVSHPEIDGPNQLIARALMSLSAEEELMEAACVKTGKETVQAYEKMQRNAN